MPNLDFKPHLTSAASAPAQKPRRLQCWAAVMGLASWQLILTAGDPAWGQTQYQFVPGSRQARPVSQQQQAAPQGYVQTQPRMGGMYLRPTGIGAPMVSPSSQMQGQPATKPTSSRYVQQRYSSASTASATSAAGDRTGTAAKSGAKGGGKSYDFVDSLNVDGVARSYRVHIPPSYDRSRATPVVLAFHGLGMDTLSMLGMSGLNGLSDRKGFIVVYGEALGHRWNDNGSGADDIGYVCEVLKKLATRVSVDQRRVYACGISNGGFFTQRLACAIPDKIAAACVVASTMIAGREMAGGSRMPIVFFLGTEDPLLPWADGRTKELGKLGETLGLSSLGSMDGPLARMGGVMSVPETVSFWSGINGCGGSPSVTAMPNKDTRDGCSVKREVYGSGDVVVYVIDGGGHTWPGMLELPSVKDICGTTCQDIDASELMWEFFQRHAR